VEGAVSTDEDLQRIQTIRQRTRILVSLGDCAVMGNVPSMRNPFGVSSVVRRAYEENAARAGQPQEGVPRLRARVSPVHEVVTVDVFVPGCPPSADVIGYVLDELLGGRTPDLTDRCRFGG